MEPGRSGCFANHGAGMKLPWWIRRLVSGPDPIQDELAFHLEALQQERREAGDTDAQAARYARIKLGSPPAIAGEVFARDPYHRMENLVRHFQLAFRSLGRQNGGSHVLAISILALGIGLSVSMFSLVRAVVWTPLPFPDQDRVHLVWKTDLQTRSELVGELAYPELNDLRSANDIIAYAALLPASPYGNGRSLQVEGGDPIQVESCPATPDFFRVLGVEPALGRNFVDSDEGPRAKPVVILSHRVWREQLSGRTDAVGQFVRLNGIGYTVIGVMGPEVDFPRGVGLWMPMPTETRRGMTWLQALVRTRTGVSRETLHQAASRTFQLQIADHPEVYSVTQRAVVTPVADYWTGSSKPLLLVSLFASLLLLLSSCASAGNLFLSRALTKRREIATRLSLGSPRTRILAQFAAEGLVAAILATAAGSLLALFIIRLLVRWAPEDIPRIGAAGLDLSALAFAVGAAVFAAVACSVGPALLLRGQKLDGMLRDGGARMAGSRGQGRMQSAFLVTQSALTVAILATGFLLFLSYRAMLRTDTGFAHRDALTVNVAMRGPGVTPETRRRFYFDLLERLRRSPAITNVAAVLLRPLEGPIGWDTEYSFGYEAGQRDPNLLTKANFEVTTPGYFETVGTPLLRGRDFLETDDESATKVAIISQSLARRIRKDGREPIGQQIHSFGALRQIVGVVADARYRGIVRVADDVYVPYRQVSVPTNYVVLRGNVPVAELIALLRTTLREVDPTQVMASEATIGQLIDRDAARNRFVVSLLGLFAGGAILLAAAGVHSVIRESLAVRAREMAVRIALGAGRARLTAQAAGRALSWVTAGVAAGLGLAAAIGQAITGLLYHVPPMAPRALLSAALFVLVVAALACLVPAWLAAGRDPRESLQSS